MQIIHAVGTIIENSKGEILLLLRHKNDPEGGTWGLVGGKIDEGEDMLTSAAREIQEEIGLTINHSELQHLRTFEWNREDIHLKFEVLKLNKIIEDTNFKLPDNEIVSAKWFSPSEAYKRNDLMKGMYDILPTIYNLEG